MHTIDERKCGSPLETAKRYGISKSLLDKLRLTGGGAPYMKVGRKILYFFEEFEQWLAEHRRTSTSEITRGAK